MITKITKQFNNNKKSCFNFQTEEDSIYGLINGRNGSNNALGAARHITPTLPPAPTGLSAQQLKRRHIFAAIVHSENSYVATLHRLVNVRALFIIYH